MQNKQAPESLKQECMLLAPEWVLLPDGLKRDCGVLVSGGRFLEIGPVSELSAQYNVIPQVLPGRLVMPGLIDSHTHLTQTFGKSLAFGEPSEIFKRIWVPMESFMGEREVFVAAKLAALEALRGGFTTVSDAGTRSEGNASAIAEATRMVGVRCVLSMICNDAPDPSKPGDLQAILRKAEEHLERYAHDPMVHRALAISIPEVATDEMLGMVAKLCRNAGCSFQVHANEHLAAVERSLVRRCQRPIEHLHSVGALGPETLIAHCTLVTPHELTLLKGAGAAFSYNPVASSWKGNAVAPALQMAELGIRFGLGTDGTRYDAFRMLDAAETAQRMAFGLASGDSSCGAGALWLQHASEGGADVLGLGSVTGAIAPGKAADFLIVDLDVPELIPSWDLPWELVRLASRDQIEAVFVAGKLRLWDGWPVDWDARALMEEARSMAHAVVSQAPIQRVHGTSVEYTRVHDSAKAPFYPSTGATSR